MIFGDSIVAGRAVPQDQTVTAHLERILGDAGVQADVINAGVDGYSTDQSLISMEELIPLYSPDIVFHGVCPNDFGGNKIRTANGLSKPLFVVGENDNLQEIPPEPNGSFGSDAGPRRWIHYSALYRALRPRINVVRAKFGRWEERSLIESEPDYYYRPEGMALIDWRLFQALLRGMQQCAGRNGAKFVVYAHPNLGEVWDPHIARTVRELGLEASQYDRYALENRLQYAASEAAVDFCPQIRYFVERQDRGPFHLLPRDPHCNQMGYRVTAEVLARHLLDRGYLPQGKARPADD
jgi:hypothetical protein